MTAATDTITPEIKVNGVVMTDALMQRMTSLKIERSLSLPGRAVIRFDDHGYAVSTNAAFATGSEVAFRRGTTHIFTGQVTGVELEQRPRSTDFVVTVDDFAYRFGLGTKVTSWQHISAGNVVKELALSYGLQAAVDATPEQLPYVVHAGNDLELIDDLAVRNGYDWWVEEKTLHFKAPAAAQPVALDLGDDLLEFTVRTTALHAGETTVTGWWPATKQPVSSMATGSAALLKPSAELVGGFVAAAELQSVSKVTTAGFMPDTTSEASAVASSLVQRSVSQAVTARGLTRFNPSITLGGTVTITDAGPASGQYFVTALQQVFSASGFFTRFTAGDRRPSSLVDNLGGRPISGTAPRSGLLIGVVTQVGNPQGDPGMVKLKFPALSETVESNWARVAAAGGGPQRGMTFLPEVNDEVLVGFEGGDFKRPIVLGGLFNGKDVAVDYGVDSGKVNRRRITSRNGHSIEFSDGTQPDKDYVLIALAGAKHSLSLSKKELAAEVPAGTPISLKAGSSEVVITNAGDITISGKNVTIKATQNVEVSGLNITAKASVANEMTGTTIALKANATAEVSASGSVSIKGAMVAIN